LIPFRYIPRMTRITCTRKLEFDAAHRVVAHESKCKHLHGHRYTVEITMEAPELDALGRVVDFGVMKEKLGAWLDENWDHNTILWEKDRELGDKIATVTQQNIFYLSTNPTAENMAKYLLEHICPTLFAAPLKITRLKLQETPNCWAEAE
jgi:6-pyruvoyltetrahydropterin/6-carboxytetrahydropterin synthase